jgi:hypothetical protein
MGPTGFNLCRQPHHVALFPVKTFDRKSTESEASTLATRTAPALPKATLPVCSGTS